MQKRTYSEAFSFVPSPPTYLAPVLIMDPTTPSPSDPTTPDRRFVSTKNTYTPNRLAGTFAPSSQPVGFTQRALQASLTGNVVFANEAIVDSVFQPSKVDDQTALDILSEIDDDKSLKTALESVLSNKLGETKKYKFIVCHEMLGCRPRC